MANAIGTLLGPMSEGLTQGSFRNPQSKWDLEAIYTRGPSRSQPRYEEYVHTPGLIHETKRRALAIALGHAAEIDLAACSMLDLSVKKKGMVSSSKMQALYTWLRKVAEQESGPIRATLNRRPLYVNTVPYVLRGFANGLTPKIMQKYRRWLRQDGRLHTKIPEADLGKYGLSL